MAGNSISTLPLIMPLAVL